MNPLLRPLGPLILLAGALACGHRRAPGQASAGAVDAFVAPYVSSNNFTGVILVARGDSVLLERGYGLANPELGVANTPRSRFHIASVTKAFTAAAILWLEERGRLRTSQPVAGYLPGYPNGEKLRLEHLLTHTSGIPNLDGPDWDREERLPHSTAELVGLFKDRPLEFEPGARTSYSNSNYSLLALIIEQVSGQAYGDFMRDSIFVPLGLSATLHDGDMTRLIPDRATGTEPDGVKGLRFPRYVDWSARTGSGSVVTTAGDLRRFMRALFSGELIGRQSVERILAPAEGFAYGWARDQRLGRKVIRAGGRSPGFNASVEHYLDDGTDVVVLTNSYSPVGQDPVFLDGLHSVIFGRAATPRSIAPVQPAAGSLAKLEGRYRMPHDYFVPDATLTLSERGDHLEARWTDGAVNTVYPIGLNRFLDRNYWAELTFRRDASGKVTGLDYALGPGFFAARIGR
ncbi:MAG TPA: serine hydrolase [Gemmatimonadales bacterium]|jgi:CubicO group peptidase (beta-lactamase class C family)